MEKININDYAIKLSSGRHETPQEGLCIMEAVSYIMAEDRFTDHPACACPGVTAFAIRTNDWLNDAERNQLLPFLLRIAGSKGTPEIERQRAYMAADYAVRIFAPIALQLCGYDDSARRLRACAKIVNKVTAKAAKAAAFAAATNVSVSGCTAATYAAAYAESAAYASASASAYAAADYSADSAALAAAAAAAKTNYKQVHAELVTARLQLLDDMLKLTEQAQVNPGIEEKLKELENIDDDMLMDT